MSKEENKQDKGVYQRRDETQKRKNDTPFEAACGAGYLLDREPTVFIAYETGIFGKRMSCITAASDGQTTGFGGEGVNGISSLPHEASEALNRIGAAIGFKCSQVRASRLLSSLAVPDPCQFRCDLLMLTFGNGIHQHSVVCGPDNADGALQETVHP